MFVMHSRNSNFLLVRVYMIVPYHNFFNTPLPHYENTRFPPLGRTRSDPTAWTQTDSGPQDLKAVPSESSAPRPYPASSDEEDVSAHSAALESDLKEASRSSVGSRADSDGSRADSDADARAVWEYFQGVDPKGYEKGFGKLKELFEQTNSPAFTSCMNGLLRAVKEFWEISEQPMSAAATLAELRKPKVTKTIEAYCGDLKREFLDPTKHPTTPDCRIVFWTERIRTSVVARKLGRPGEVTLENFSPWSHVMEEITKGAPKTTNGWIPDQLAAPIFGMWDRLYGIKYCTSGHGRPHRGAPCHLYSVPVHVGDTWVLGGVFRSSTFFML